MTFDACWHVMPTQRTFVVMGEFLLEGQQGQPDFILYTTLAKKN